MSAILLSLGANFGHEVWIEDTPMGEFVARFAEYGEDLKTSPNHLNSL